MTSAVVGSTRHSVGTRLRRLVAAMLVLLVLVGAAGVAAVEIATGQVGKLTNGYTPAGSVHATTLTLMLDADNAISTYQLLPNVTFRQSYQATAKQVLPSLDETRRLLGSIGEHRWDDAIAAERSLAAQWMTRYANPIAAAGKGVSTQAGRTIFAQFRAADQAVTTNLTAIRLKLRQQANRLRGSAIPLLVGATAIALLVAAILAIRTASSITRPLRALRSVVSRLDRGDLTASADEHDGPSEVRALARTVNAMGRRARAEATEDRDAEQFRQRTRLISSAIRRTTSGTQMAEQLVRGLSSAFEVDRVWLHTFNDERVPRLTAQWQRENLTPLPDPKPDQVAAAHELAARLWDNAHVITIDNHRAYEPTAAGRMVFEVGQAVGASASMVVPVGDAGGVFGVLWMSMVGHARHWTMTETGVAQYLAADLAHSLAQAYVIERQAEAVELLRELDQAKADFVSTVSHELRTPLTSISGYLEMLQDGDAGDLSEPATAMLTVIDRNATRLRNLIEDLLTQSRIDAGRLRMDMGPVDLASVLDSVFEAMLPLAAANDIELHLTSVPDLKIEADPQQLEQVFTNLISNACKFTPAGGEVRVELAADESEGAVVWVTDTGMGIPAAEAGQLFTRFFRASNATAAALPGTGLGLAIVREIVQRHGGTIDVESDIDTGTTFTVWLPRSSA